MKCPHCGNEINVGQLIGRLGGQVTSRAKTKAARANAKLGGWPKGKKRGKRVDAKRQPWTTVFPRTIQDANQIAHGVVAKAEKLTRQGRPPQRLKVLPSPKAPKRAR